MDMSVIKENLKRQIKEEKPRCAVCGKFFGFRQIIHYEVISVIQQDNHFQIEDQWYEHKKCRL